MASRCNTEKSSRGPNQPHFKEIKDSTTASKKSFEVPSYFISSQSTEWYPHDIPIQPTHDPSYTSSPDIPHQDSSSNKELQGVSTEEPLYLIPKTEVNQLRHHTRAYLKSLGQIPIIYQIPRSRFSQRRTQPYGDGETITSNIDDLIIDKIYEIHQPIVYIVHFETSEDPLDFQGDSIFFNFLETQVGGFGPPDPLKTNPPLGSIPSPRLNFTFGGSMAANPWWLTINPLAIFGPQNDFPKNLAKTFAQIWSRWWYTT